MIILINVIILYLNLYLYYLQLTGKLLFWSVVSLLPREPFDPFYIRPFETILSGFGITPGIGPLSALQSIARKMTDSPRQYESGRSYNSPAINFIKNIGSMWLKDFDNYVKYVRMGIL